MNAESAGRLMPSWFTKAIILAVLALLVGGAGTWVGGVNNGIVNSVAANTAQEVRIGAVDKRVDDVLDTLNRIEEKIDAINEREWSRRYAPATRTVYRDRPSTAGRTTSQSELDRTTEVP